MADDAGDKTEAPTPRRRRESRQKGQVARSQELNAAVMLLGALVGLALFGGGIWRTMLAVMRSALAGNGDATLDAALVLASLSVIDVAKALAPLMIAMLVVGLAVLIGQVGWLLTLEPLMPKLDKLNPINGIKRLFSPHSLVQLAQNVVKLSIIIGVAWLLVRGILDKLLHSHGLDFAYLFPFAAKLVFEVGIKLTLVLLVLALVDYVYQRYRHEKQLKMTKEEVKEEMKRMEGDPVVKRRRREVQMRLAAARVSAAVPQADVVVTNPTHYAVAIRYDHQSMAAPKVVAKGADYLAQKIRDIATASGVPIVEKPQLARMLFAEVEVGQEIPERFYRLVAEVLAYIYEMSGRSMGPAPVPVA